MARERYYVPDKSIFEAIRGTTLFYPCSGMDIHRPIRLFSHYIDDFWFVDRGYFSPGYQDTSGYGCDAPADEQIPLLRNKRNYRFIEKDIRGPVAWDWHDPEIEPCVLGERYEHLPTNRKITIHRRRGYGYSAFRTEKDISPLGVFFYRGDSMGEGGSGNQWLAPDHLSEICERLIDGGLIVTDGSGSWHWDGSVRKNWGYQDLPYSSMPPEEMIAAARPFTEVGCRFTCRGYVGHRYGPTLVWQVKKVSRIPRKPGPFPPSKYQNAPGSRYLFR